MDKTIYYWIDNPSFWEILIEDELFYYVKPLSRPALCIEQVNKTFPWIYHKDKEEYKKLLEKEIDRQIKQAEKNLEFINKRKPFLLWEVDRFKNN